MLGPPDAPSTAEAWCCPREAAAQEGEVSAAFPTFSPPIQQAWHSMQVNTFSSIARDQNIMIEAWEACTKESLPGLKNAMDFNEFPVPLFNLHVLATARRNC